MGGVMYLTNNLEEVSLSQISSRHPHVLLNSKWKGGTIDGVTYLPVIEDTPPATGSYWTALRGEPYIDGGIARVDWEIVDADIEQARLIKYAQINAWRNNQEAAGFKWNGELWDSDNVAIKRMAAVFPLCLSGINPPTGYWTTATNKDVPLTAEDFVQLYTTMLLAGGKIHDRQRQMKHMVSTLWTIVDIQNFVVDW